VLRRREAAAAGHGVRSREIAMEDQLVAAAVLDGHLARAPLLILPAGPIALVILRADLGVKRFEVIDADADRRARRAVPVDVEPAFAARDAHVQRRSRLKRCSKSISKPSQSM